MNHTHHRNLIASSQHFLNRLGGSDKVVLTVSDEGALMRWDLLNNYTCIYKHRCLKSTNMISNSFNTVIGFRKSKYSI